MPIEIRVIGSVEAYSVVSVHAQITGQLTAVNFKEGDDVAKNQVLFALDRRPLEAALMAAQANLQRDIAQAANARVVAQRYADLAARSIATTEQVETSRTAAAALEATVEADKAAVENAKVQLQYATIASPIDGRTGGDGAEAPCAPERRRWSSSIKCAHLLSFTFLNPAAGERFWPKACRSNEAAQRRRAVATATSRSSTTASIRRPAPSGSKRRSPTKTWLWPGSFVNSRRADETGGGRRADGGRPGRPAGPAILRRRLTSRWVRAVVVERTAGLETVIKAASSRRKPS
jgi:pyruvate/2-oxoglutarate dehydrogenase complex dihydrolipoamide acyltransferase (E2) component